MASIGQVYYNVLDSSSGEYISSGINIYQNILSAYGVTEITKVGIQANPGTKVVINDAKTIMIGRTGIYELDNIKITSLYFIRPKNYVKDETASQQAITSGTTAMLEAETQRQASLTNLQNQYPQVPTTGTQEYEDYWNTYTQIQDTYIVAYAEAQNEYTKGILGVYTLPNSSDPNAEENYQDLYNVIIDFLFE